jgi:hypothetical protein
MKTAQFIKGMIDGTEVSYESPDLLQLLPSEKLSILWDQERIGTHNRIFLDEHAIAKTVVTQSEPDEHGRLGVINHTVIYRFDASVEHDGIQYLFPNEQFAKDARAGKFAFKMPPAPELKKPLDTPPKLEVQL